MSNNNRSPLFSLPKGGAKLLFLGAAAITELAIYIAILKTYFIIGYVALYVLAGVLAVLVFLFSGGGIKTIPSENDLRDDWSADKKKRFIAFLRRGKKINKVLTTILIPLIFILGFDIVKVLFFS